MEHIDPNNNARYMIEDLTPFDGFVLFWKPTQVNGYLGNWFDAPFDLNGIHFPTSEHYMMYEKAMLMGDDITANDIVHATDPKIVKALGREVNPWNETLWINNRCRIMFEACMAKFRAHPDIRASLIATGNTILVEASPLDKIWGIGMGANNPDAKVPIKWRGLNLLGRVLMKVRQDLI